MVTGTDIALGTDGRIAALWTFLDVSLAGAPPALLARSRELRRRLGAGDGAGHELGGLVVCQLLGHSESLPGAERER